MDETATLLRLAPADLSRLLRQLATVDAVELKLSVPEDHRQSTIAALGLDPLHAQIRQVAFFDTPDLALDEAGLVLRARRVQGKAGDSVVKLRPVDPEAIDPELRRAADFGVEVDAMPGGFVCSGSLKAKVADATVRAVLSGRRPVRSLFTKLQKAVAGDHLPDGVVIDDLVVLGPLTVLKLKFAPEGLQRGLVAELWSYPNGSRLLELSTKCTPEEAFHVAVELRAYLGERGVPVTGEQRTKTRTALDVLSQRSPPVVAQPG